MDYVRIPNTSPMFDAEWETNGYMDQAVQLLKDWVAVQGVEGLQMEIVKEPGRTPLLFIEVQPFHNSSANPGTVLLYGHLDKQPPFEGWLEGLGPCIPVIRDGFLYGRGPANDGYAVFAAIAAIKSCQLQGASHSRCVIVIEACEESGSPDLPYYIHKMEARIGIPNLVVCLDSGCGNYDQMWLTTSLRGMGAGTLRVNILTEGVHSGDATGVVPDSMRIARSLLSRIENEATGEMMPELHVAVPPERMEQAKAVAEALGKDVYHKFPFVEGAGPVATSNLADLVLNKTWRPQLAVTGAGGLPPIATAGNVLRPETSLRLSVRIPPTLPADHAIKRIKEVLEKDPPYGARAVLEDPKGANGWDAPVLSSWLEQSLNTASMTYFGKPPLLWGEGGSIPFMAMLGRKFPEAQFVVTGVLGPHSNAHGPNECLHIEYTKKIICCVTQILADQCKAHSSSSEPSSKRQRV
eukprot:GILK01002687.1.p1 GENE.GILK01002687.1~~GILK01002687.1.p1  ORF type:complete len:512 (+),score=51.07 GILK01002687.1:139-1536(+)